MSDEIFASLEEESPPSDPSTQMEKSEEGINVKNCVKKLPEKLRTPVVLSYFNALSHSEIAEILKCSPKTVETRLYRARKLLKEYLGGSHSD